MESTMINDEVMQELITLLRENNMKCETNDTFDICNYIDGLQDKISGMQIELDNIPVLVLREICMKLVDGVIS